MFNKNKKSPTQNDKVTKLWSQMRLRGMVFEETQKPKSMKEAIRLLKNSMNGAPEEAYKGIKSFVFKKDYRKYFTKSEICDLSNYVAEELGDLPEEDVNRILKRHKLKCDISDED